MLVALDRDIDEIISYLKAGFQDCIFMYIDIKKYRLTNPAMKVWLDRRSNGSIGTVVMKYHTGISIYSDSSVIPLDDISYIIQEYAPKSITGRKEIIEQVYSIHNNLYTVLYGAVFKNNAIIDIEGDELVEPAKDEDMLEIAKLICSDEEIGSYYDIENLAAQLLERKHTGMGRNYIIRRDGKIVGHVATYAEFDHIAVSSGLIVDNRCKGEMYGAILGNHLFKDLKKDGFDVYSFIIKPHLIKLHKMIKDTFCGEYGKMMRIE